MTTEKISYAQREALKRLQREDMRRSCTNPTLKALERRGLAELRWIRRHGWLQESWRITPAGRAAIAPPAPPEFPPQEPRP